MTTSLPQFSDWDKANALLAKAQRIILLTHVQPDGDAIGSMLGLSHTLRATGRQTLTAVDGGCPSNLHFLPAADTIQANLDDLQLLGSQPDLVIVLDCGDEKRVGQVGQQARLLNLPWINLDHHRTNTGFGDANLMDPNYVSAAEGVIHWLEHLDLPLTQAAAQCLMCGMVTDTLCFRTSSVNINTFGLAQKLMAAGANLTQIVQNTVNRIPTSMLRLWGQVMPTVRIEDHVAWVSMSLAARREAGYFDTSDGGLVSLLLQADDAYISCVLKERENNQVELGFRAVPGFDVSEVATALGGGGHMQASGATVQGTLLEVEARVIPMLKEAIRHGKPNYD